MWDGSPMIEGRLASSRYKGDFVDLLVTTPRTSERHRKADWQKTAQSHDWATFHLPSHRSWYCLQHLDCSWWEDLGSQHPWQSVTEHLSQAAVQGETQRAVLQSHESGPRSVSGPPSRRSKPTLCCPSALACPLPFSHGGPASRVLRQWGPVWACTLSSVVILKHSLEELSPPQNPDHYKGTSEDIIQKQHFPSF